MNALETEKPFKKAPSFNMKAILLALLPLILLASIIGLVVNVGTGIEGEPAAPIEKLNIERIKLDSSGFIVKVLNSGPEDLTIAQVIVDDSFWNASYDPGPTLKRLEQGTVYIPYPWVQGDPHQIKFITSKGLIFIGDVVAAAPTPEPAAKQFLQFALIGL
jgi:ZIP family zinc transporter